GPASQSSRPPRAATDCPKTQGRSGTCGVRGGPCDGQPVTHAFMFRMKESEVYPAFFFAYPVMLTRFARHNGVGLAPRAALRTLVLPRAVAQENPCSGLFE